MDADRLIEIDERWRPDDAFEGGRYPEGARTKTRYLSPRDPADPLMKPNHWYLFKESRKRTPWQFWMEVFAYRIGLLMGVEVPPAYAASAGYREDGTPRYGALIEWFYRDGVDRYLPGSVLVAPLIPGFDFASGKQHNLQTNLKCFASLKWLEGVVEGDIVRYWAPILTFDTVIGNTDRHQDNWGIVTSFEDFKFQFRLPEALSAGSGTPMPKGDDPYVTGSFKLRVRLSPAFDNGTSMSYEFPEEQISTFGDERRVMGYLTNKKAHHHMKWSLDDTRHCSFHDFIGRLVETYPYVRDEVEKRLAQLTLERMHGILAGLPSIPVQGEGVLTLNRLEFTMKMIDARANLLRQRLGIL